MEVEKYLRNRIVILKTDVNPSMLNDDIKFIVDFGFQVVVTVADYDFNISWRVGSPVSIRHYQCTFGDYPQATKWELQYLNEYFLYEIAHGRNIALWCQSAGVEKAIINSINGFFKLNGITLSEFVRIKLDSQSDRAKRIPKELTHCKACKEKKCITEMICHVSSVFDAKEILGTSAILSATKTRQRTRKELALEDRNAAGDPPDYF